DVALDLFLLGRSLDHHVAIAEQPVIETHMDAVERGVLVFLADLAAGYLARQVAVDRFPAVLQRLLADIRHHDVVAGEGADMGYPSAHLAGANNADAL